MPYYIGIANSVHDPAIAVIGPDGELLFAEALERSFQKKRAWNIPPDHWEAVLSAIEKYCDPMAEFIVSTSWSALPFGVDSVSWNKNSVATDNSKLPDRSHSSFLLSEAEMDWLWSQTETFKTCGQQLKKALWQRYGNSKIEFKKYDHHLCHAATACFSSDFKEALCLVVDGTGEVGAVSSYHYCQRKLKRIQRSWGAGSLGNFYSKITEICDFEWIKGEEGKVMGLAAYGTLNEKIILILEELILIEKGKLSFPKKERIKQLLEQLDIEVNQITSSEAEKRNIIACAGQYVFENSMKKLICNLHDKGLSSNLVLGGGCAINSSSNGKILSMTPFQSVHVPSAPGDDGNAFGAAALAFLEDSPIKSFPRSWKTPYLGSVISKDSMARLIESFPSQRISYHPGKIHTEGARLLSEGNIIGWVQGRAEFGPRALGNRSILADPRVTDMKDQINKKIKFREDFRPFAPSILEEHVLEWFEEPLDSPYMSFTLKFKENVCGMVPAVVHQDGTGRLQTVTRQNNEKYYDLISAFYEITQVPMVLNTSFNVMGKPIIHTLEDAVSVLYTTGLDCLIIDDYLIRK